MPDVRSHLSGAIDQTKLPCLPCPPCLVVLGALVAFTFGPI